MKHNRCIHVNYCVKFPRVQFVNVQNNNHSELGDLFRDTCWKEKKTCESSVNHVGMVNNWAGQEHSRHTFSPTDWILGRSWVAQVSIFPYHLSQTCGIDKIWGGKVTPLKKESGLSNQVKGCCQLREAGISWKTKLLRLSGLRVVPEATLQLGRSISRQQAPSALLLPFQVHGLSPVWGFFSFLADSLDYDTEFCSPFNVLVFIRLLFFPDVSGPLASHPFSASPSPCLCFFLPSRSPQCHSFWFSLVGASASSMERPKHLVQMQGKDLRGADWSFL